MRSYLVYNPLITFPIGVYLTDSHTAVSLGFVFITHATLSWILSGVMAIGNDI